MGGAIIENFGYRQWLACVRAKAWWTVLHPASGWGEMTRVGLTRPAAVLVPPPAPPELVPVKLPEPAAARSEPAAV